jgi:hypothetical protein
VNQTARTTLLAAMPTLDDIDIASVQRGDLSHGVVIPGTSGLGGAAGGRGRGDGTAGGHGGILVDGRGGCPTSCGPIGGQGGGPTAAA